MDTTTETATPRYMNRIGYSDTTPYEVVRVVSATCVVVREMVSKATHKPADLDPRVGGFCCHFAAQDKQTWEITSDPSAPEIRVRLSRIAMHRRTSRAASTTTTSNHPSIRHQPA
jgi:hypothetical protein